MVYDNQIWIFDDGEDVIRRLPNDYGRLLPQVNSYVYAVIYNRYGIEPLECSKDVFGMPVALRVVGYKEGIECYQSSTNSIILSRVVGGHERILEYKLIDIYTNQIVLLTDEEVKIEKSKNGKRVISFVNKR